MKPSCLVKETLCTSDSILAEFVFRVQGGSGFRVQGLGFRVWGKTKGLGFRALGGFGLRGRELRILEFRV